MSNLQEAIQSGDLLRMSELLKPYNINAPLEKYSDTPLLCAVKHNQIEAVKLLIQFGADLNLPYTYSPVSAALYNHNYVMAELLIEYGVKLNTNNTYRPLNDAIEHNSIESAAFLVEHGADVNNGLHEIFGLPPILLATQNGQIEMVQWLLEHGAIADTYVKDSQFSSTLFCAIERGNLELVQLLLEAGAGKAEGVTALHIAVLQNDIPQIESLIAQGIDVNLTNDIGQSPLHYALCFNNIPVLEILKHNGADLTLEIEFQYETLRPMEMAFYADARDACLWLLENGVDINQQYEYGDTILSMAVRYSDLEFVTTLLDKGANMDAHDKRGDSLLSQAVSSDSVEMIHLLVNAGAQLNIQNDQGRTELFEAAIWLRFNENDNAVLKLLLELGSDPCIKDNYGRTALDYFKEMNASTSHLVPNYDAICKILSGHEQQGISESEVIQKAESLDVYFDNNLENPSETQSTQVIAVTEVLEPIHSYPPLYCGILNEMPIQPI